jgi:hypothetical protein
MEHYQWHNTPENRTLFTSMVEIDEMTWKSCPSLQSGDSANVAEDQLFPRSVDVETKIHRVPSVLCGVISVVTEFMVSRCGDEDPSGLYVGEQ